MKKLLLLCVMFVCTASATTVNLNWIVDNTDYTQTTCETGGNLVLPPAPPAKYGYTFRGWALLNKNLYNPATRTDGYFIDATGTPTANDFSSYSALIPVLPNTTYTFSGINYKDGNWNKRLHAYDVNGNWIRQLDIVNCPNADMPFVVTGTTTATTAYVRVSFATADTNVQVEHGSTATTYEPYFQ